MDNRFSGNFVSTNVVNLSRRNLKCSEIYLFSKGLNSVPTSNTIDEAKLKIDFDLGHFKQKFTFHSCNKDAVIEIFEIYMSSLEEKIMKIALPKDKHNNHTSKERQAWYDLKNDKNIIIKGADKGLK